MSPAVMRWVRLETTNGARPVFDRVSTPSRLPSGSGCMPLNEMVVDADLLKVRKSAPYYRKGCILQRG